MSNDWIEHNGGPQPVADDVWVQIEEVDYWTGDEIRHCVEGEASSIAFYWLTIERYRILNQHLIDAARLEGIRLGLEAAEKAVGARRWRWSTWDNHPRLSQWAKSLQSAYEHCEFLIRNLNPETIAKEAQHD